MRSGPIGRPAQTSDWVAAHDWRNSLAAFSDFAAAPAGSILALQRAAGNRAVSQLVESFAAGGEVTQAIRRRPRPLPPHRTIRSPLHYYQARIRHHRKRQPPKPIVFGTSAPKQPAKKRNFHREKRAPAVPVLLSQFESRNQRLAKLRSIVPTREAFVEQSGPKGDIAYRGILEALAQYDRVNETGWHDLQARRLALIDLQAATQRWRKRNRFYVLPKRRPQIARLDSLLATEQANLTSLGPKWSETLEESKKKHVEVGAELEMRDQKHREAEVLGLLHAHGDWPSKWAVWRKANPARSFFDWVDHLEATDSGSLVTLMKAITSMKSKLRANGYDSWDAWTKDPENVRLGIVIPRITYFRKQDQESLELRFTGTNIRYKLPGPNNAPRPFGKGIYVMAQDMRFYGRAESLASSLRYHHTSLLAGVPVGAAGVLEGANGVVKVDLESGHYRPGYQQLLNVVRGLEAGGVPLGKVWASTRDKKAGVRGNVLLAGFRGARDGGTPQSNADVKALARRLGAEVERQVTADPVADGFKQIKKSLREVIVP